MIMVPWEWREGLVVIKNNQIYGCSPCYCRMELGIVLMEIPLVIVLECMFHMPNDQVSPTNHMIKNNVVTGGGGFHNYWFR